MTSGSASRTDVINDSGLLSKINRILPFFEFYGSDYSPTALGMCGHYGVVVLATNKLGSHPHYFVKNDVLPLMKMDKRTPLRLATNAADIILSEIETSKENRGMCWYSHWFYSHRSFDLGGLLVGVAEYCKGEPPIEIAWRSSQVGEALDKELLDETVKECYEHLNSDLSSTGYFKPATRQLLELALSESQQLPGNPASYCMFRGLKELHELLKKIGEVQ